MKVDDLRDMLHTHAEDVSGAPVGGRIDAVHGRVGAVRRRRVVAVVAAAVAVAGVAIGPTLLPGSRTDPADQDAPARLAGWPVPPEEHADGFPYAYARGLESPPGGHRLRLDLPAAGSPRLVSWTTSVDDPDVRVVLRDRSTGERLVRVGGGFGPFHLLPPGTAHDLVVTQPGASDRAVLGLAVYELTGEPPAGVTDGEATFRARVLQDRLLGARIGRPGEDELRFQVPAPAGRLRVSHLCYGVGAEYLVHVAVGGDGSVGTGCSESVTMDPGQRGAWVAHGSGDARAGSPLAVRVWLSEVDDPAAEPVSVPGAVIGAGVYDDRGELRRVAGQPVPVRLEHGGHEWVMDHSYVSPLGQSEASTRSSAVTEPRLVVAAVRGMAGWSRVVTSANGEVVGETSWRTAGEHGTWYPAWVAQPGAPATVAVRVPQGATGGTQVGFATYRLVR